MVCVALGLRAGQEAGPGDDRVSPRMPRQSFRAEEAKVQFEASGRFGAMRCWMTGPGVTNNIRLLEVQPQPICPNLGNSKVAILLAALRRQIREASAGCQLPVVGGSCRHPLLVLSWLEHVC